MLILLVLLWIFGGVYCAIVDWTESFDLKGKDVGLLIIAGIFVGPIIRLLVGPIIRLFDCIGKFLEIICGKWWHKTLIRRKH